MIYCSCVWYFLPVFHFKSFFLQKQQYHIQTKAKSPLVIKFFDVFLKIFSLIYQKKFKYILIKTLGHTTVCKMAKYLGHKVLEGPSDPCESQNDPRMLEMTYYGIFDL